MKKLFLILALGGLFLSCSDDDDDNVNALVPINLTSRVTIQGRDVGQNVQIAANQQVSFFVTETESLTNIYYNNALLTADGNGNFSYSSGGQNVLYYPVDPVNVDFYAVHPYYTTTTLSSIMSFSVNLNQTILANYYNSDLLYSQVRNVARTRNTVPMVFNHKLSKLNFVIRQGAGLNLSNLNSVNIMNVLTQINMNVTDGNLVPITGTTNEVSAYGVRGTTGNETELRGITAIIVPQSFVTDGTKQLFRLDINGVNFYYVPAVGIIFEEGKQYNFTLTVNNTGITVTSSIVDWLPGDDIVGDVN